MEALGETRLVIGVRVRLVVLAFSFVLLAFGTPGVGQYIGQVDQSHRAVAAVQRHPRRPAGRAHQALFNYP